MPSRMGIISCVSVTPSMTTVSAASAMTLKVSERMSPAIRSRNGVIVGGLSMKEGDHRTGIDGGATLTWERPIVDGMTDIVMQGCDGGSGDGLVRGVQWRSEFSSGGRVE